ncbi:hypothetical protein [Streptomyces chartreusis]|uniref:hypothetical protein n=1 Tax=Streptomyces chartreusis TaxID=1969 RepID=UPI0036B8EEB8
MADISSDNRRKICTISRLTLIQRRTPLKSSPALRQSGFLEADQREVEETVGAVIFGGTVSEVGKHAAMEAGVVQLHGHGLLEVDAAADRLGGLAVGQAEQELQHTDGGRT